MSRTTRHQVIKGLQATLPRGAPFDLPVLNLLASPPNWLPLRGERVAGAPGTWGLCLPNDAFDVNGALLFLQRRVASYMSAAKARWPCRGAPQPGRTRHAGALGRGPFRAAHLVHGAFPGPLCECPAVRLVRPRFGRSYPAHPARTNAGLRVAVPERARWNCCTRLAPGKAWRKRAIF